MRYLSFGNELMQELVFTANYTNIITFTLDLEDFDHIHELLDNSSVLQSHGKRYRAKFLVADLSECAILPAIDKLKALTQAFTDRGLNLGGIIHPNTQPEDLAGTTLSLIYPLGQEEEKELLPESLQPLQSQSPASLAPEPAVPPSRSTLLVQRHIRAGQRVYAPNADLVIMGTVNAGAEVIADGNISVFGELRGRAFAGAKGDQSAFIYAHRLSEAVEILAIAHCFRSNHQLLENREHVGCHLVTFSEEGDLQFRSV